MDHRCEDLVAPHRTFVDEADFITNSASFCNTYEPELGDLHLVHLFLFNDLIVIASKRRQSIGFSFGGTQEQYNFKAKLIMKQLQVGLLPRETDQAMDSFFLKLGPKFCPDRFYSKDEAEVKRWVQMIQLAIDKESRRASVNLTSQISLSNISVDESLSFPTVPEIVHQPTAEKANKDDFKAFSQLLLQGKSILKELFILIMKNEDSEDVKKKIKVRKRFNGIIC